MLRHGSENGARIGHYPSPLEDQPLAAELPAGHRAPVADEALVARPARPGVRRALRLLEGFAAPSFYRSFEFSHSRHFTKRQFSIRRLHRQNERLTTWLSE